MAGVIMLSPRNREAPKTPSVRQRTILVRRARRGRRRADQGDQGQDAALAVVVGAQHQPDVLER